jgi:hypothetical protein
VGEPFRTSLLSLFLPNLGREGESEITVNKSIESLTSEEFGAYARKVHGDGKLYLFTNGVSL